MSSQDAVKWVLVVFLVGVAITTLVVARGLIAPLDGLLTSRVCNVHGDEISREVIDYERSNRFGLVDRSHGWCLYGPLLELDENGDPIEGAEGAGETPTDDPFTAETDQLLLTLDEIEPDGLYTLGKAIGIVLQLGAASLAVRVLGDPLLERFVRRNR